MCGDIELCSTYVPGRLLEMNSFVWNQVATNINLHMHVKTVNEKPYHPPESTGNIFSVHLPSGQLMEQLASDTCTNERDACNLNRIGWQWGVLGVCQLLCQATAVAQFHVHIIFQLLKIKSLQRKQQDVTIDSNSVMLRQGSDSIF